MDTFGFCAKISGHLGSQWPSILEESHLDGNPRFS